MSIESTKAVMEAYWHGHGTDQIAEDAVFTMMVNGEETVGREAIGAMVYAFYNVLFDGEFETSNSIIGDGNAVLEGFLVGKHTGEFAGIPPTGKDVRVPMCIVYDVADDKVQRARIYFQMSVLLQQLGLM